MTFRYTAHGRLFGLKVIGPKVRKPNYRPWAVIRIKSDRTKSAKTELPPMGGISESPGMYNTLDPYQTFGLTVSFW